MSTLDFFGAIDGIWSLGDRIADLFLHRHKEKRDALRAISIALDETFLYYERQANGEERNRDTEEKLAKYWSAAAIEVRRVDEDLALRLDAKSQYWVKPNGWSEQDIVAAGIKLETVRKRYREMLAPKRGRLKGKPLSVVAPGKQPVSKRTRTR